MSLSRSERAIARALRYFEEGSRDPRLLVLIADRFSASSATAAAFLSPLNFLDILYEFYRASGEGSPLERYGAILGSWWGEVEWEVQAEPAVTTSTEMLC